MASALGMPERAVHLVRAGAKYQATSIGGYYVAVCGYQCMRARTDYLRGLPTCEDCQRQAQHRTVRMRRSGR